MHSLVITEIEKAISRYCGKDVKVQNHKAVGGGCINEAMKLQTTAGNFFIKLNDSEVYPGIFDAEKHGLELISATKAIAVPKIIASGQAAGKAFLILEWIESGKRAHDFFKKFGRQLAVLHSFSNSFFGLEKDNYIGSLLQFNKPTPSFEEFFITQRLEVQLKMAVDQGRLPASVHSSFEKLYKRLQEIIPPEKPALLHGDLWSGNYMTGKEGYACLLDPAVYYGHRESDLAMTLLFGGFDNDFYEAYHFQYPLEKDWRKRVDLFNLYPLLVHVNLFGGGYASQVMSIIRKF